MTQRGHAFKKVISLTDFCQEEHAHVFLIKQEATMGHVKPKQKATKRNNYRSAHVVVRTNQAA